MTTEVVVMNREAVAMAADSAVTISGGKIFDTANKLYMLGPGYPVGVLVYNNASFMNVPWEIIIKAYRMELAASGRSFGTLSECAADFVRFVREGDGKIFSQEQQEQHFASILEAVIQQQIIEKIQLESASHIINTGERIEEETFANLVNSTIDNLFDEWDKPGFLLEDEDERNAFKQRLHEHYGAHFDAVVDERIGQLPITQENRDRLWELCTNWFVKNWWFDSLHSGIVFAGYGDNELYPACVAYKLESIVCDYLKIGETAHQELSWVPQASINPYAQDDVIINLISGIHPRYSKILREQFKTVLEDDLPPERLDSVIDSVLERASQAAFGEIIVPILTIVAMLPKDELASMAENLVSITSFMRRVSRTQETVGGPIDVAVISKKDGFIWIKRKHYFDPTLNYHFFSTAHKE